jgi:hypothetical protein
MQIIPKLKTVTPQAKGRVERLWATLQDHLVIELHLQGVNTIDEANKALPKLIAKHNKPQTKVKKKKAGAAQPRKPAFLH